MTSVHMSDERKTANSIPRAVRGGPVEDAAVLSEASPEATCQSSLLVDKNLPNEITGCVIWLLFLVIASRAPVFTRGTERGWGERGTVVPCWQIQTHYYYPGLGRMMDLTQMLGKVVDTVPIRLTAFPQEILDAFPTNLEQKSGPHGRYTGENDTKLDCSRFLNVRQASGAQRGHKS